MLLNRQRVKFWQKIIFGAMAALMAGFLIFGYSGVSSGCHGGSIVNTGNSALDQQAKAAQAALKKNPNDPTALLQMAQVYQAQGNTQQDGSAAQATSLTQALAYYSRYLKLSDATLGATASDLRFNAMQSEVAAYIKLLDYGDVVKTYKAMIKLRPKDPTLLLGLGSAQANSGQTAPAIATFQKYLKLQPNSQYAGVVQSSIAQLQASTSSPSPSGAASGQPSPSPSATK